MSKRMRSRITFSNVVALLALFFALGGSVYAASKISGKTIKSNSIPANRIKANSLSSKQIKDNTLTAVKTSSGLAKVTYAVATGTLSNTVSTPITVTATCPSGQKAIGGGASVNDPVNGGFVSYATFTADRSGYVGTFFSGTNNDTGTVIASCVPVSATG
jgi:hypothetical protein